MSVRLTTGLIFTLITLPAIAGWFTPRKPDLVVNRSISVTSGSTVEFPIEFKDRSTYRISIMLDPINDFHSPEGKKIRWGEEFGFHVDISSKEKSHYTNSITQILDHSMGYGLEMLQVPKDIPYGTHTFRITFTSVPRNFNRIYNSARITIEKLPYLRFLD